MASSKSNHQPSAKKPTQEKATTSSASPPSSRSSSPSPATSRGAAAPLRHETPAVTEPQFEAQLAPQMENFEPLNDREFKAHLYQQLLELQPYFTTDSQVSVEVDQDVDDEIILTLSTTWGENRVDVLGRGDDIYTALADAKSNLMRQIEEWYGEAIDSRTRDAEINAIREGAFLLH